VWALRFLLQTPSKNLIYLKEETTKLWEKPCACSGLCKNPCIHLEIPSNGIFEAVRISDVGTFCLIQAGIVKQGEKTFLAYSEKFFKLWRVGESIFCSNPCINSFAISTISSRVEISERNAPENLDPVFFAVSPNPFNVVVLDWDQIYQKGIVRLPNGALATFRWDTVLRRKKSPRRIYFQTGKVLEFARIQRIIHENTEDDASQIEYEIFGVLDPDTVTNEDRVEIDSYHKNRERKLPRTKKDSSDQEDTEEMSP
jgi:hypothetical protein